MTTKIFLTDSVGAIYRKGIFQLLDKTYDVQWLFGTSNSTVKSLADDDLVNISRKPLCKILSNWHWHKGAFAGVFGSHRDIYILDGQLFSLSNWAILIINAAFFKTKKIYLWSHGWYGRENRVKKILKKIYFGLATGAFFYGDYAKKIMHQAGGNVNNVKVIHNSLDYNTQFTLRKASLGTKLVYNYFKNDNPTIVFIGRLTKSKKLHMILEAAEILKAKEIIVNIIIIGTGEDEAKLKAHSREKDLSTWFYGPCYDESINAQLIAQSDICVSPGNVGLTAIHCLMFGTPVITHSNYCYQGPEFEAIIPGKTGDFFIENSVESLAKTIADWFEGSKDREEIRQNCYAEIDESWNPQFQLNVIKSVIDNE